MDTRIGRARPDRHDMEEERGELSVARVPSLVTAIARQAEKRHVYFVVIILGTDNAPFPQCLV